MRETEGQTRCRNGDVSKRPKKEHGVARSFSIQKIYHILAAPVSRACGSKMCVQSATWRCQTSFQARQFAASHSMPLERYRAGELHMVS